MRVDITILGAADETRPARAMIVPALQHSASLIGIEIVSRWLPSDHVSEERIRSPHGVFVAPGAPSEDFAGILQAIRVARAERIPCLGTCGGFQRIVTEYALHELGIEEIEHEELSPGAIDPFFLSLQRSLVGEMDEVLFEAGSVVAKCYRGNRATERFACSYGLNPKYVDQLRRHGLRVSGVDAAGDARVVELRNHPFFLGTLFVPQVRSTAFEPHPIITAFVTAATKNAEQKDTQPNKTLQTSREDAAENSGGTPQARVL